MLLYKKTDFKDPTIKQNQSYILGVEEGDIEDFYIAGYEGNIYKLHSSSLFITNNNFNRAMNNEYMSKSSPYVTCSFEPDYVKYNTESMFCDWLCSMYNLNIH